jgi:hypothetical protein
MRSCFEAMTNRDGEELGDLVPILRFPSIGDGYSSDILILFFLHE